MDGGWPTYIGDEDLHLRPGAQILNHAPYKASHPLQTPEHGINLDLSSLIRSNKHEKKDPHIGWFRTLVQLDKTLNTKWPEHSQGESAATVRGRYD